METDAVMRRALVLGAGGHAAMAWETGVITGLADAGVDVRDADLFVGTSAGSIVAAQITSGLDLDELFERYVDARAAGQPPPAADMQRWRADLVRAKEEAASPSEFLRRVGALGAAEGAGSDRRRSISARLPVHTWPARRVLIAAVDAERGERHVFDNASGVPIVDAVTASSAVSGVWPAATIDGRPYIDGGFYSTDNADLAAGHDRVLIVTLRARVPRLSVASLDTAVDTLRAGGAEVVVVHPDDATDAAFGSVGGNLLNPAVRPAAARAGREQGRQLAAEVAALWR
jgi:NTE family protein